MEKELMQRYRESYDVVKDYIEAGYVRGEAIKAAAETLGRPVRTIQEHLQKLKDQFSISPEIDVEQKLLEQANRVQELTKQLREAKQENLTRQVVREELFGLAAYEPKPPEWIVPEYEDNGVLGIANIFASDWQWGEVVESSELNGYNAFNLEIAHARAQTLIQKAVQLLYGEFQKPRYPGVVFILGGDMVSGDSLHDDLTATNEQRVMPCLLDLLDVLIWCIDTLKNHFGRVHVPCVPGNHGRTSRKPPNKERNVTNWDWLLGQLLERHYKNDPAVTFQVENSPDCYYRVYDIRYCLHHGDQFRGGDGIIGPLGPVTRGRYKKINRDIIMRQPWDVMLVGHFHWLMMLDHMVINGSLPGYNQFAYNNSMHPTRPGQACWIQHPREGITHWLPIYLDKRTASSDEKEWLSVNGI